MSIPSIITFSRRTDPAFFMDWFMDKIEKGFCLVPNPFSGKPYRVGLKPEEVLILSFWTRNPLIISKHLDKLQQSGYHNAFFITYTSYPAWLEPYTPEKSVVKKGLDTILKIIPPNAIWWRYDPIIITESLTIKWHTENFTRLCDELFSGKTGRVIISLAHIDGPYVSIRRRLEKESAFQKDRLLMPSYSQFIDLAHSLSVIASSRGISLEVCCSPKIQELDHEKIRQGGCLTRSWIEPIVTHLPNIRSKGTRKGSKTQGYGPCGCLESRDIGVNGTCRHGCVYCYANRGGLRTGQITDSSQCLNTRDIGISDDG